jgi:vacuolar-type H+-ATPase subunit H
MKTAVDYLISKLPLGVELTLTDAIEQAKEMEKQQIVDARVTAPIIDATDKGSYETEAEQYYQETYGK